jgi:hypothetical protein
MDFFQGAVETYLRADRANFINPEFYLQRAEQYENGKKNWYVDILAANFRDRRVHLCEVTYARQPTALRARLKSWAENWDIVKAAVHRDARIPEDWTIRVWVFCPEGLLKKVIPLIPNFDPPALVTTLEMVVPWKYSDWNRIDENEALKHADIPDHMRR